MLKIVGFDLADEKTRSEMIAAARWTGGDYLDARDQSGLRRAILQSLAVPFVVLDQAGAKVGEGITGSASIDLPAGSYQVVLGRGAESITLAGVEVVAEKLTQLRVRREGQALVRDVTQVDPASAPTEETQPSSPTTETPGATPARSLEERLVMLKRLLDRGLIDQAEYNERRAAILDDL